MRWRERKTGEKRMAFELLNLWRLSNIVESWVYSWSDLLLN